MQIKGGKGYPIEGREKDLGRKRKLVTSHCVFVTASHNQAGIACTSPAMVTSCCELVTFIRLLRVPVFRSGQTRPVGTGNRENAAFRAPHLTRCS